MLCTAVYMRERTDVTGERGKNGNKWSKTKNSIYKKAEKGQGTHKNTQNNK